MRNGFGPLIFGRGVGSYHDDCTVIYDIRIIGKVEKDKKKEYKYILKERKKRKSIKIPEEIEQGL